MLLFSAQHRPRPCKELAGTNKLYVLISSFHRTHDFYSQFVALHPYIKFTFMFATVDKVEVKKLYETFVELSNGGKESLDKETFKKGLNKLEACGLKNIENTPFADRLFHLLDVNGDGTVDLSELVCGLSMLCKGSVEEKLERMSSPLPLSYSSHNHEKNKKYFHSLIYIPRNYYK